MKTAVWPNHVMTCLVTFWPSVKVIHRFRPTKTNQVHDPSPASC